MIRALLVDDEAPARRRLRLFLADAADVTVVGEAHSGASAVEAIWTLDPDVVFLDVQMPEGTGFDVVAAVGPEAMPATIFVTAFDEHAIRAFDVAAVDYILKPFSAARLLHSLHRVRVRLAGPRGGDSDTIARALGAAAPPSMPLRHLLVEQGGRCIFLPVERIDWATADRNYVRVHADGRTFTVRTTLQAFAARLEPARFLQVNRSQVVRLDAVREAFPWSHGDFHLVMHDGTVVVWSRRYRARDASRFAPA